MIKYLENVDDFEKIIQNKVLVDFYADWCGPCRMLGPILEELENIQILKVNVDNFQEIANKYGVMSIPTLILFNEGKEINKMIGLRSKSDIEDMIK